MTADTITKRIAAWTAAKTSMMTVLVGVTLDGQPLEGATVTFEPEPFLGTVIQSSTGTTNAQGTTMLKTNDKSGTHVRPI